MVNEMILNFERNKIDNIDEFALSLKDFSRLENLELHFSNIFLTKLPSFS